MNNIQSNNNNHQNDDTTSLLDINNNPSMNDLNSIHNQSIHEFDLKKLNNNNNQDSHLYGVELINDLKERDARELERKNQYSRKSRASGKSVDFSSRSTPFSQAHQLNFIRDDIDGTETPFEHDLDSPVEDQLDRTTPRRVKKKIRQLKLKQKFEEQERTHRVGE